MIELLKTITWPAAAVVIVAIIALAAIVISMFGDWPTFSRVIIKEKKEDK